MHHETRSVTVRMRGLTNDEGGMSSPSPSAAHVDGEGESPVPTIKRLRQRLSALLQCQARREGCPL